MVDFILCFKMYFYSVILISKFFCLPVKGHIVAIDVIQRFLCNQTHISIVPIPAMKECISQLTFFMTIMTVATFFFNLRGENENEI